MHYKEEEGGARLSKVINRQGCSAVEAMFPNMAIRVVEFSNGGYKIRKIFD